MFSLRTHVIICASLFVALLMLFPIAAALHASGLVKDPAEHKIAAAIIAGGLLLAFAFSVVPVIVKLVLGFQKTIGNQDVPVIRTIMTRENLIIWGMWALMAAGLAIAIPAAIADGAFGSDPQRALGDQFIGESQGVLSARPGMTVGEMVHASTLKLATPAGAPVISGGAVFEFRIPGSAITFPSCRYYFISTLTRDPTRIEGMSIGTSHGKLTRAESEAADAALHDRLAADGWLTGHEVYRSEEDRQLHGGLKSGPEGRVWLKNDTVLSIESTKVDEVAAGQDPDTAPVWIQAISLRQADDYSGFDRFKFAPMKSPAG